MGLKDFFQASTFASLAAAAAFVWIVVNGIRVFFGFYKKWVALVISFMVVATNVWLAGEHIGAQQVLLLIGNAFLLALTSIGLNEAVARGGEPPKTDQYSLAKRRFISSWF
jgi:uncharacterized membrane protein YphA (DoxX/SURF4 family)